MLEIQVCRRSRNGVVVPIARDDDPALVRRVARAILKRVETWQFEDELLAEVAARQRRLLEEALAKEGIPLEAREENHG